MSFIFDFNSVIASPTVEKPVDNTPFTQEEVEQPSFYIDGDHLDYDDDNNQPLPTLETSMQRLEHLSFIADGDSSPLDEPLEYCTTTKDGNYYFSDEEEVYVINYILIN